jgi:hypothetical protein
VIDEPEYEELEEMHAALRDHMVADHILRVTDDQEQRELLSSLFAQNRVLAETLRSFAMVLRRVPATAEGIADSLETIANTVSPEEPEEE